MKITVTIAINDEYGSMAGTSLIKDMPIPDIDFWSFKLADEILDELIMGCREVMNAALLDRRVSAG